MTRSIGPRWKRGDTWSWRILIDRGLNQAEKRRTPVYRRHALEGPWGGCCRRNGTEASRADGVRSWTAEAAVSLQKASRLRKTVFFQADGYLVLRERIPLDKNRFLNIIISVQLKCLPSDNSGEETPVPIPNTEVKLSSADGSWGQRPCESRSSLGKVYFIKRPALFMGRTLFNYRCEEPGNSRCIKYS